MREDVKKSWENFLNPETLRSNLIVVSVFLSAFEILKECIIERPKEMYTNGFDENGLIIDEKYKSLVLSLNKSPLYASLEWFKKNGVIDQADIETFTEIKNCRNALAHELPNFITEGIKSDPIPNFTSIIELLGKIEKWWVFNFEVAINPDLEDVEVDENEIIPGRLITLQLLTDIALGPEEKSEYYYKEFIRRNIL
ncbi:hypothetical protein [Desulfobacter latus]|uniref:DUF4145 domain-containing protein n=1 Tax=Desulfobacter latus TaxID=2292 RepID=A0A850TD40_9BACT|nr:hypothetical protein [Desulfobacter latus]NWH06718.1 hypothetical protein [Desulfobacter latus]